MGQQMSTDDQDEGFKNIICRMLQEADNEDGENPRKKEDSGNFVNENEKSTEKIDIDSGLTGEQNRKDNCDKNIQKENKKVKNVGEIENCQKPHKESVELNDQSHVGSEIEDSKLHVDSKEVNPQNMDSKDNIENISTNTSDTAIDKETVLNTDKIKREKNIYSNGDDETESEKISEKNENTADKMTVKEEVKCLDTIIQKEMCADNDRKDVNEKHKSLETMFLKDRIDSLINSCLSSKPSEVDLEVKKCLIACNVKANAENNCSTLLNVKQERENDKNVQKQQRGHLEYSFNSDEGKNMSENSGSSTSVSQMQNIQSPLKLTGNQNENNMKVAENLHEASKQKEGNLMPRETTTFQTLIEKVLDNSLSKTKKCDSSQNANGFRQIVDHRITSRNQLHTIKNEIRNELLGKEASSTDRLRLSESKSDDMSLNKSKVVYLKDHIEKVLEKTFQNSSRKDSEDIREQERIATKYDERYQQNRESDQRILQRERSHSLVNDSIRHPVRDRSQSFSMIGTCPEVRRHKSLDNYDLEHLGPPKLIKVTEIYPDVNRDQGRYLQPPRIDTYDGNSRGSFRGSMSPGGSYSRSPLDQSPVSPYYNHSPNSWHGHSPREQHPPVPSNLSPNHTVPSPIYPSTRYPVSPGNSYPPNVGLTRYNNTSHVTHPTTQISSGSRVFQPPYPQTSPLPGYPVTALEGNIRPGYTIGNQQISPNSQHPSRHYPQQHLPARNPITSTQAFHSNELVNHSKYQVSPVHNYQQVSPRQPPYPTNHPQISPTSRSHVPYPIQTTQPIQRPMMQPQQQYPAGIDNNQNYPPATNMHHVRQSHVNSAFPSHGVNSRNNSVGYIDHNAPHRNAQTNHQVTGHVTGNVPQRMAVPLPRSPQYMESNGRNPSVSSAMALGPVPPQHYFKQHQSQKPPQLFPSSPPISSVREYSGISNRTVQNQPHGGSSRPDVKYKQQEMMDMPSRIPSNSSDHIVIDRPSNVAHQQTPVLDLSVKRDSGTVADSDPDMQPLDLTCKPKSKSSDPPQKRSLSKGYTGFEYLVKGPIEKRIFEENLGSSPYVPNMPKQSSLHDKSQYSSQGPYSSFEPQNKPGNSIRQSSETAASNHGYSQNIQSQQQHQQQAVSAQSAHQGYKQNPPMGLQIPTSNQSAGIIEGNITPTESGAQGQGQSSLNQSSQLQDSKKVPNVSRHEPIQNILGSHSPNDILYLICRLCGQTYGSPYGFRKHFRNQHGFEPRAEHTIVQTISETKTAMQSPPTNCQALMIAQQPNPISVSEMDESQIRMAQNQSTTSVTNSSNKVLPNSSSHLEENVSGQSQNAIKSPAVLIKEESIGSLSSENSEEYRQKGNVDDSNNTGNRKCLECHECGQTFQLNDFGAYKRHCRQHGHPKINNPFDPNYSADLNRNVNSGDGFKSFKDTSAVDMSALCKKCDIPFTSESALKEHMKTIHPELLNFACETCKEKFLDEISYQNHIKNVHFQTTELNENTINVKKRIIIIGDFQKSQVDSKQEEIISSTSVLKSAADSMVTTASPDSSSDMIKKSSGVVDSQLGPQTPTIHPPSDKQSGESDSNLDEKTEFSCQNSCDSATQKMEDSGNTDGLYLHKKFGSKRKYLSSYNSDIIESKISKKDVTSPGNTRSPSVISTNSCDSELSNIPDGKMDVSDSNLSQSDINIDGSDESKSMVVDNVKCSTANKTEARHQLPFVWDRVTRSQVGRKPQKNN